MGFSLGKIFKKVVNIHKKVFKKVWKGIRTGAKSIWENKWARIAIIGATVVAGGMALAAYGSSAASAGAVGQASALGTGTATTAAGTAGAATGATAAGTAAGAGTGAAMSAGVATPLQTALAGTTAAGSVGATPLASTMGAGVTAGSGGGLLASAGNALSTAGGYLAANPTATMVGGMALSSAMQAKMASDEAEKQRKEEEKIRNSRTYYGVSYDGKTNENVSASNGLMDINNKYRNMNGNFMRQNQPANGLLKQNIYKANGVA